MSANRLILVHSLGQEKAPWNLSPTHDNNCNIVQKHKKFRCFVIREVNCSDFAWTTSGKF